MEGPGIVLLVISSSARCSAIQWGLEGIASEVLIARNRRDVQRFLVTPPPIEVVITDLTLSDGNWLDVLGEVAESRIGAKVVVTSPEAKENLWSEVLHLGGFDVLVEPYDRKKLQHVIGLAMQAAREAKANEEVFATGQNS